MFDRPRRGLPDAVPHGPLSHDGQKPAIGPRVEDSVRRLHRAHAYFPHTVPTPALPAGPQYVANHWLAASIAQTCTSVHANSLQHETRSIVGHTVSGVVDLHAAATGIAIAAPVFPRDPAVSRRPVSIAASQIITKTHRTAVEAAALLGKCPALPIQ